MVWVIFMVFNIIIADTFLSQFKLFNSDSRSEVSVVVVAQTVVCCHIFLTVDTNNVQSWSKTGQNGLVILFSCLISHFNLLAPELFF